MERTREKCMGQSNNVMMYAGMLHVEAFAHHVYGAAWLVAAALTEVVRNMTGICLAH